MRHDFQMPDIGEGIAEIEIIEWLVKIGDEIHPDQIVATIQTDKSLVEMPSPLSGKVIFLGARPGDMLQVGGVLIAVESDSDNAVEVIPVERLGLPPDDTSSAPISLVPTSAQLLPGSLVGIPTRAKAAPSVRRLATELGVNLATIRGSGPGGRIISEDILAATGVPASTALEDESSVVGHRSRALATARPLRPLPSEADDEHVPLRGLRRQIAKKMVESWRSVPHIIDYREVDATRLLELRQSLREAWPDYAAVLTFVPIFAKVAATALRRNPLMNASFDDGAGEYVLHRRIHIGIATATSDGLLVPVVRDADRKSILDLAIEFGELVELTRSRKASLEQLTGGTYTVNNLGAIGTSMGTPIINTPQVGTTGFGRITDRVVARDGVPVVRPMLTLSSVGDHRLLDGDSLGTFTGTLVRLLENPYELIAELV
jgi:pyruvate dehydrogenase E2 component (dihydrolipoamide acetyltransferase)